MIDGFHANVGGPIQRITASGSGQGVLDDPTPGSSRTADANPRTDRGIYYLETDARGSRIAYQYQTGGTTHRFDREGLGYVDRIAFDPTGALVGAPQHFLVEGSTNNMTGVAGSTVGRMSPNMALDSTGRKIYYAFTTGGNENLRQLVEFTVDAADPASSIDLRFTSGGRFNVLHSGR